MRSTANRSLILYCMLSISSLAFASDVKHNSPSLQNFCNIILSYHAQTGEDLDVDAYAKLTGGIRDCNSQAYLFENDVFKKRERKLELEQYLKDNLKKFTATTTYHFDSSVAVEHYNFDTGEFNVRVNSNPRKQRKIIKRINISNQYLLEILTPKLDIPLKPSNEEEARKIENAAGSEFRTSVRQYDKTVPARFYLQIVDATRQVRKLGGKNREVNVVIAVINKIDGYYPKPRLMFSRTPPKLLFSITP
jgi:hypothetical protein